MALEGALFEIQTLKSNATAPGRIHEARFARARTDVETHFAMIAGASQSQ